METHVTRPADLASRIAPLALAAPLLLAGCAADKAPTLFCPQVAVLQQASHFVSTKGDSIDVAARTLDARITGVGGHCKKVSKTTEQVDFRVGFVAHNGPASTRDKWTLPYFIAISQGDRIIDKKIYPVSFDFRNGSDQAVATTTTIRLRFPRAPRSGDQQVLVGFQMTPAEIARATGETVPAP